jgi:hypothetical protein
LSTAGYYRQKRAVISVEASRELDRGYADFYEKALFVKPTWRLLRS